jgi:hypothetical protein
MSLTGLGAFGFSGLALVFLASLSFITIDGLYISTVNGDARLTAQAGVGRPRRLYSFAFATLISSTMVVVGCIVFAVAAWAGRHHADQVQFVSIAEVVPFIALLISAALAVRAARYGVADWDASDDLLLKANADVAAYASECNETGVVQFPLRPGAEPPNDRRKQAMAACLGFEFSRESLQPCTTEPLAGGV